MAKKFVEPVNDTMYSFVAPDGSIQLTVMAPDLESMVGMAKLLSNAGVSQTARQMLNKGFTIHKLKVSIENIEQVKMHGGLMAACNI